MCFNVILFSLMEVTMKYWNEEDGDGDDDDDDAEGDDDDDW